MAEVSTDYNMVAGAFSITQAAGTDLERSFEFPQTERYTQHRRLKSMNAALPPPGTSSHRRGTSALPSFTFNAGDSSGLHNTDAAEGCAPNGTLAPVIPNTFHKRNTSELAGDLDVTTTAGGGPGQTSTLASPRRNHRYGHSRSRLTLSSHDLSSIISPKEQQPRSSTSLPNTPLEHPVSSIPSDSSTITGQLPESSSDDQTTRPPSRPKVEFSDNVEYISRPLSTISSETTSSISTMRGHSINDSISSVLSSGHPNPQPPRLRARSVGTTGDDEPRYVSKPLVESSRHVEKEGRWLRSGSTHDSPVRPLSEPVSPPSPCSSADGSLKSRPQTPRHKKNLLLSDDLGFSRRRSEPAIGIRNDAASRTAATALYDKAAPRPSSSRRSTCADPGLRSSSRRLKDWALSRMNRRSKETILRTSSHVSTAEPESQESSCPSREPAVAETDLDAVFGSESLAVPETLIWEPPAFDMSTPYTTTRDHSTFEDSEDHGIVLDLDAALGPFNTPQSNAPRSRQGMHSSRGTKDFLGPGGHYQPVLYHRRTESAPALAAFDQRRIATPPQGIMADVFEEDEEEMENSTASRFSVTSGDPLHDDESAVGVQIVDSDMTASTSTPDLSLDERLQTTSRDLDLQHTRRSEDMTSRHSASLRNRHCSIIEDTIAEESSPLGPTIVESHEEPRSLSDTKSSDSSERTIMTTGQTDNLTLPGTPQPDIHEDRHSNMYSSTDVIHPQNSLDTSRIGTSASSIADTRTMSSWTTGDALQDTRVSVDDVPSLTSSRSTMISTMYANTSRRDISTVHPLSSSTPEEIVASPRQDGWKRASIQSLSQLVGAPFGPRPNRSNDGRPQTAAVDLRLSSNAPRKKENRLKKFMFWKSKHRHADTYDNS